MRSLNPLNLWLIGIMMIPTITFSQSFSKSQIEQGYAIFGDNITFIFDEVMYNVLPARVVVTGEFCGWDNNMLDPKRNLIKSGQLWLLTLRNINNERIKPNTKFKFRIDEGEWLRPPLVSKNEKEGDLVFLKKEVIKTLEAEILNNGKIWAKIYANRSLNPENYFLTNSDNDTIKISGISPNGAIETLLLAETPLNKKRVYWLHKIDTKEKTICSFEGWFRSTFSTKELGANIRNDTTTFRIFCPRATSVKLYLYRTRTDSAAYDIVSLKEDKDHIWEIEFPHNLHGVYYDYTVHGFDDPGTHFFETNPVHINDPYARVSDDTWGKCRVWNRTVPAKPLKNGIPKMEDVIAYEVHVQDFTENLPVEDSLRGTFLGMIKSGLKNKQDKEIGFDYLVELGINVIHLMPVQEYVHYPDDDWKSSFQSDPYMVEQGINIENYQWGYRTTFAMAIESRYRTKNKQPGAEREEFRDLVQAFHDHGIAVIIDIVPNHTGENMDGNQWYFNFNAIDKDYYYRTKNFQHIGAFGNEIKSEERPMTQRWIIDQCLHFINEFGVDGFRIDLAGQIDQQTLIALKESIGNDKIVYGEPWMGSNDPNYENNPDWDWYKADSPITFFQDDSRGSFKGPVFELKNKNTDRGWSGGKFDERKNVMRGLENTFRDDKTPVSGITYLDIHDNFALADQFGTNNFDGRYGVDQKEYKIATTLLYTSLGPIVTHGGSEIMRSKAHAPLKEVVKETKKGYKLYFHGYRDTYNLKKANEFLWSTVGQKPTKENSNNYENMFAFWKGMNSFRLSEYGKVFRVNHKVPDDYYTWITPEKQSLLGYMVSEKVLVLINAGKEPGVFNNISMPNGKWSLIGNIDEINLDGINKNNVRIGGKNHSFLLDGLSINIWIKE